MSTNTRNLIKGIFIDADQVSVPAPAPAVAVAAPAVAVAVAVEELAEELATLNVAAPETPTRTLRVFARRPPTSKYWIIILYLSQKLFN